MKGFTAEDVADILVAVERFVWVSGVYELGPYGDPDAFAFGIVLSPYGVPELVQTHYALVEATGGRSLPGRVLYIDGKRSSHPGRRLSLDIVQKERARTRIDARRAQGIGTSTTREMFEAALAELAKQATGDAATAQSPTGSPYRGSFAVTFGTTPILEVVADPFPSPPRKRVLVIDEDPSTAKRIETLPGVDVIAVDDGWSAVDRLTKGDVDLAVCAVSVGGFSGAKIHKLVATARPEMAKRIVFLASESAVAQAPPSSASGRVLTRPVEASAVASVLEILGAVREA